MSEQLIRGLGNNLQGYTTVQVHDVLVGNPEEGKAVVVAERGKNLFSYLNSHCSLWSRFQFFIFFERLLQVC